MIELLVTIAILWFIILIVVMQVNKIMENAQKQAFNFSIKMVVKALNDKMVREEMIKQIEKIK